MSLSMTQTLKRGVGRKILGLFLLAGILPVIFTAALAYYEVGRGTQAEAYNELHASAKAYGVDILVRLETASDKAHEIVRILNQQGPAAVADHAYLLDDFEAVWVPDSAAVIYGSPRDVVSVDGTDPEFLASGETQLTLPTLVSDSSSPTIVKARSSPSVPRTRRWRRPPRRSTSCARSAETGRRGCLPLSARSWRPRARCAIRPCGCRR